MESADRRTRGFVLRLKELGVRLPKGAVQHADFRITGGMEAATRLLGAHPELTAIFCANDQMAVGAIRAASLAGRSVPGDLSVVGFDDSLEARVTQPPLTTVSQPIETLAARAMAMLRGNGETGDKVRLTAHLVIRQSTGPVAPSAAAKPSRLASDKGESSGRPRRPRASNMISSKPGHGRKRILVLGAGRIGKVHAKALSQIDRAEIAGICDPDLARATELADAYGAAAFADPLEAIGAGDVDAIIIGSSSDTHLSMVRLAARHGLQIFCEKPRA